ncbi:RidA family protein [Ktedonosporobacter rubrisoli]|uniref:RidA family protein n=1 Tax=Ktedonosporobacter rubrisoli TaxID=2509675 RepID=A0A4P6JYZ3_KTERU|nr:RidA family protein [Ktedonosporobacter rubrisoli]QBD80296.1 RidA family protein [Ktedonosporobacter rubrisoli]
MSKIEQRLQKLGYVLPAVFHPAGSYEPYVITGNLLYLSGAAPQTPEGKWVVGKVGAEFTAEQAYEHARLVGMQLLAVMKEALGDLSRVKRVVKVLGMVNAEPEFTEYTKVINGCSDLFAEVLGEAGKHARAAVGMAGLPGNVSVEVEAIVEIA